jgi:ABC-2 type transport system permease protein
MDPWSANSLFVRELGLLYHYDALSKGLVDSRDLVYFLTVITGMLLVTRINLGTRSW